LGKYELLMPLAAGGMARIYIGRTTGIGAFERHVVLKLITPERANDTTAVGMFLDEARLAASLNHQNVAQVFEVGEESGIHYLAMEYVHGQDLRALLAKAGSAGTRIPLELALTVVAGAAAGLHHAHERRGPDGTPLGIVHRDVSPSNIMIGYDGAVKLLDFGIAKATHRSVETQSGIIKGKFAYMAPEQCRGRDVDRRSDVFSLGIILYEISTQHRCFRADSDFDTMHRIVTGDVVRPTRLVQNYPAALEAIVMKALAIDAVQRYQSSGQLLEAIESFAVSARMSLSTMGLGRFMRDMFGEIQEPWLLASRGSQPVMAKESTISSTDGRTPQPSERVNAALVAAVAVEKRPGTGNGIPDEDARFPDSAKSEAARTILDLPRGNNDATVAEDDPAADWNPKSYPAPVPQMASAETLPPDAMHSPPPSFVPPRAGTPGRGVPQSPQVLTQAPQGSQPPPVSSASQVHPHVQPRSTPPPGSLQQVPANQFNTSPSSSVSRPAFPAQPATGPGQTGPIPSTKHGYHGGMPTGAGVDLGYPRYEKPGENIRLESELSLKPNRRPLIIGGMLAGVGIVIILIVKLGGIGSGTDTPVVEEGSDDQGSGSAATPVGSGSAKTPAITDTGSGSAGATTDPAEDMITVHVESTPVGADVLVAGQKIGVTPLDTKLHRGTKVQPLVVRLAGYVDATAKIDLSGDFSKKVTLKTPADAAVEAAGSGSAGSASATPLVPGGEHKNPGGNAEHKNPGGNAEHKTPGGNAEHKNTGTGTGSAATEHHGTPTHQPKCQVPGPNMDPINGPPLCKPGEKP
jgi:serine/threonine protein kinase